MTSYERMTKRLKHEIVDRPPNFNIFMTFAAHYIKQPLSKYYLDYRVLVDANMAMVENFNVDIVQAISDPFRETYDFGARIEFPEDDLPVNKEPFLDNPEKLKMLQKPNPSTGKRMSDRLNALRLMREKIGNEIPVMGWVEGALAEAGDLRGITNVLMDVYERPQWLKELLEIITEVEIEFAKAQVEAGAHIIGLGDAIASQVSPAMYKEYGLPYENLIEKDISEGVLSTIPSEVAKNYKIVCFDKTSKAIKVGIIDPGNFKATKEIVRKHLDPDSHYFLIRFAKLNAHHDTGIRGISDELAWKLIELLSQHGRIYITSERPLSERFEPFRLNVDPLEIHHVMAFAQVYVGDSQTMAAEAGVLGVPFLRFNDFVGRIGYLKELEERYKLGYGIRPSEPETLFKRLGELLQMKDRQEVFQNRRTKMLEDKIDLSKFMVWFIENYPQSVQIMKETPDYQYNFR